jgi:RNA methyltransferase, TrmH family
LTLSDARTRLIARLRTRKGRAEEGLVLVEGPRAVATALHAGARFRFGVGVPPMLDGFRAALGTVDPMDWVEVDTQAFSRLADTEAPQGVLGVVEEPRASLPGPGEGSQVRRFLILDGVQDPGNAGTLIRSAAAFGLDGIIALDGTVDPWNPKAVRAAAGEIFRIAVLRMAGSDFLDWWPPQGLPLWAADARGEDVRRVESPSAGVGQEGWGLALGNEGAGLRPTVLERADRILALPLVRPVESLNVAVAGSILLWELGPGRETPALSVEVP